MTEVEVVAKSMFTHQYDRLREMLVESRKAAGMTQAQVAECLHKPQSFVSKYERGERRLDVVEFLEVAQCVGIEGAELVRRLARSRNGHARSP